VNYVAYCIVTIDVRTGQPSDVGIYSEEKPTADLRFDLQLTAMSMRGPSYAEAAKSLVDSLRNHPGSLRWLYDRLSETDRRLAFYEGRRR
jgi:hypothetical protein